MYSEYQKMLGAELEIPEFNSEEEVNHFLSELDRQIASRKKQTRWLCPESAFKSFVALECVKLHRLRHIVASQYYDRRGIHKEEERAG